MSLLASSIIHHSKEESVSSKKESVTITVEQIRKTMTELDLARLNLHFVLSGISDDSATVQGEVIEPYVVCEQVSVDVYNQFIDGYDDENWSIELLVVEYPSKVHENTVRVFENVFLRAFGGRHQVATHGSMIAHRSGLPRKEADSTYGPPNDTPNAVRPPHLPMEQDWITFVVEIGHSQNWKSLQRAAQWWYGYEGIQYILILKISTERDDIRYCLYDVLNNPMVGRDNLPPAVQEGHFQFDANGEPENITLDNHRILSIPANLALPPGVNDISVVNLRDVMNTVIRFR